MFDNFKIDRNSTILVAEQIENLMVSKIKKGLIKPGMKLLSTKELAAKWNVNPLSVQRAMNNLKNLGMLDRRVRHGTFVKNSTPKVNIAILCPDDLAADKASYNRLVVTSMRKVFLKKNWHSFIYDQFPHNLYAKSAEETFIYNQFAKDVRNGMINAYVAIALGDLFAKKPDKPEIPFVRISQIQSETDIMFDYKKLVIDTIKHSLALGRKQICLLGAFDIQDCMQGIQEIVKKLNLPTPEIPMLPIKSSIFSTENEIFNNFTKLVKKWLCEDRIPETLIVTDDIAMRTIALVLLKEQISVPENMLVISAANESIDIFYGIPVSKYEFPSLKMSNIAVNILEARMQGKEYSRSPIQVKGAFLKINK